MVTLNENQLVALLWHDFAYHKIIEDLEDRRVEAPDVELDVFGYFLDVIGIPPESEEGDDGDGAGWCRDGWYDEWLDIVRDAADYPEQAARHFVRKTLREADEIRRDPNWSRRRDNGKAVED